MPVGLSARLASAEVCQQEKLSRSSKAAKVTRRKERPQQIRGRIAFAAKFACKDKIAAKVTDFEAGIITWKKEERPRRLHGQIQLGERLAWKTIKCREVTWTLCSRTLFSRKPLTTMCCICSRVFKGFQEIKVLGKI